MQVIKERLRNITSSSFSPFSSTSSMLEDISLQLLMDGSATETRRLSPRGLDRLRKARWMRRLASVTLEGTTLKWEIRG